MEKVRLDKWLWSVRIFKSRTKATEVCKKGNVTVNDSISKPSHMIRKGDTIGVKKNGFNLIFKVEDLLNKRVSATLAAQCYTNLTPESELNKYKDWYIGKGAPERRDRGAGRPTKRERRELEEFKEGYLFDWDD